MWAERYFALLRQEMPERLSGVNTMDDFVHILAITFAHMYGRDDISFYPPTKNDEPTDTIAYCEECYKQGYSAIINDGKLLGFRRENAL